MLQKDLFDANVGTRAIRGNVEKAGFLQKVRWVVRLDQVLMGVIAFLIADAVVFALGVEKGKHDALRSMTDHAASAASIEESGTGPNEGDLSLQTGVETVSSLPSSPTGTVSVSEAAPTPSESSQTPVIVEMTSGIPDGEFTIQLVTYKWKSAAERMVDTLSKKGLQGFIIPSGAYQLICVNAFASREKASRFLSRLKAEGLAPPDAFVRNIPT